MTNCRILLVDDDHEDRSLMQDAFKELGHDGDICFAENGEDAIEALHKYLAANNLPRLVVLDLNMPRMNGTQTLQAIKSVPQFNTVGVIILSTGVNAKEREACLNNGAMVYMVKPISYKGFLQVAEHLYDISVGA